MTYKHLRPSIFKIVLQMNYSTTPSGSRTVQNEMKIENLLDLLIIFLLPDLHLIFHLSSIYGCSLIRQRSYHFDGRKGNFVKLSSRCSKFISEHSFKRFYERVKIFTFENSWTILSKISKY